MFFLPDYAEQQGISESRATFLVAIFGISTTVFRVSSGCLVYFFPKHVKPMVIRGVVLFVVGAVTWGLPHMTSYGAMAFVAILCGMLSGKRMR